MSASTRTAPTPSTAATGLPASVTASALLPGRYTAALVLARIRTYRIRVVGVHELAQVLAAQPIRYQSGTPAAHPGSTLMANIPWIDSSSCSRQSIRRNSRGLSKRFSQRSMRRTS